MRTLKKTLCLVLALVLCFGLVGTAFAGNFDKYTDAEKVGAAYKEAVDVMMGAGIIEGMSATELAPEGVYTREQAAKIVAYMKLGKTAADKLSATADPFKDVAANRWSAGYIAYCAEQGIIKGYGDGKFGPTDSLTGYAFGAMLLRAVGYGLNGEYDGASWSIAVAKDAIPLGVYAGDLSAAVNESVQRQQAILMAFNTLVDIPTVKWSTLLNDYVYTGSTPLGTSVDPDFLSANFNMYNTAEDDINPAANAVTLRGSVAVEYAPALRSYAVADVAVASDYTKVGRAAHVWYKWVKGEKVAISDVYFDDALLGTSSNGTSLADLTNFTKPTYIAAYNRDEHGAIDVECYMNGSRVVAGVNTIAPRRGGLVELYDVFPFDGDIDYVIYTEKTVATVGLNGVKYNSTKTTATIDNIVPAPTSVQLLNNFADLKFGDVVLYLRDGAGVYHFEKAETFQAQLKKTTILYTGDVSYLIGENNYLLSGLPGTVLTTGMDGYNLDYNYYTDNFGNIVDAVAVQQALSDFVVILDLGTEVGSVFNNDTPYAKILKMDGTTEIVKVSAIGTYTVSAAANKADVNIVGANEADFINRFYTYVVSPVTGAYAFTAANIPYAQDIVASAAANTVRNNVSAMTVGGTTFYANASTVYIYATAVPGVYATVTGIANAPTNAATATISVLGMNTGRAAKYVFINAQPDLSSAGNVVFFVNPAWYLEVGANAVTRTPAYRQYQAIVNGELTTVDVLETSPAIDVKQGVQAPTFNLGRISAVSDLFVTAATGIGFGASDSAVVMVGTNAYTYTVNTKVYEISISPAGTATLNADVVGVGDITADVNDLVYVVPNTAFPTQADALYIIKASEPVVHIAPNGADLTVYQGVAGTTACGVTNSTVSYAWFVNGVAAGTNVNTLGSAAFAAGNVVTVLVTYTSNFTGARYVAEATYTVPVQPE